MMYAYRCYECWNLESLELSQPLGADAGKSCNVCGGRLVRVASFYYKKPLAEHWNASVGKPISSERQFADELKRQSEAATLRTGMEHNYVPVDHSDTKSLGVTGEGLEETARRKHDLNLVPHSRIVDAI